MKHVMLVAGLSLVIVACGGENRADDTARTDTGAAAMDTMAGMGAGAAGATSTIRLNAVDNSGVDAEVTTTAMGEQTTVSMHLTGGPANAVLPAHIHAGTCANKGAAVAPLDSVRTDATGMGMINSTVSVPFTTVNNGQHFVQVHMPNGNPAACGDIPAR